MISWEPLIDLHVRGASSRGPVWIRLSPGTESKVTGIYLMFNSVVKLVPKTQKDETLAGAKRWAEEQIQLMDWAEELAQKNNRTV